MMPENPELVLQVDGVFCRGHTQVYQVQQIIVVYHVKKFQA
jgi:hypothetical protein